LTPRAGALADRDHAVLFALALAHGERAALDIQREHR
jgi:hypothetical protein